MAIILCVKGLPKYLYQKEAVFLLGSRDFLDRGLLPALICLGIWFKSKFPLLTYLVAQAPCSPGMYFDVISRSFSYPL
jgi:hypothetical protein